MKNLTEFEKALLTCLPLYCLSIIALCLGYYPMGIAGLVGVIVFFIMAVRKHSKK